MSPRCFSLNLVLHLDEDRKGFLAKTLGIQNPTVLQSDSRCELDNVPIWNRKIQTQLISHGPCTSFLAGGFAELNFGTSICKTGENPQHQTRPLQVRAWGGFFFLPACFKELLPIYPQAEKSITPFSLEEKQKFHEPFKTMTYQFC